MTWGVNWKHRKRNAISLIFLHAVILNTTRARVRTASIDGDIDNKDQMLGVIYRAYLSEKDLRTCIKQKVKFKVKNKENRIPSASFDTI